MGVMLRSFVVEYATLPSVILRSFVVRACDEGSLR
jgi:hypothetical protein